MVYPVDYAGVSRQDVLMLLRAFAGTKLPMAVNPVTSEKRGHPVLLRWDLAQRVLGLGPEETLRDLLSTVESQRIGVATRNQGVVENVNDPGERGRLLAIMAEP